MRVILAVLLLTILAISLAAYKVHNSPVYDTETEKAKKMHDFSVSELKRYPKGNEISLIII